jgi:bifunctional ADP-heptose synthase (sugar kinase/adenylyltransferase)
MIDISNLREKLHNLSKAKVLCVGDIMLDKFTYGSVDRISPEAPILDKRTIESYSEYMIKYPVMFITGY